MPQYLILILISEKVTNWAFDCLTGTTIPQINWKYFINRINVNIPHLIEQQQKINTFSQLENWNSKIKNLIWKTTSLISIVFIEKSMKFRERIKIKEVCSIDPSENKISSRGHLVSFILLEDLEVNSPYVYPKKTKQTRDKKGYTRFQENDLLLAKISPSFENGKMSIAKNLINGVGLGSTEFVVIRTKESTLAEWIYYCLKNPVFFQEGLKTTRGTGQQRIKTDFVSNYLIPFPSFNKQKNLLSILQKLENLVAKFRDLSELTSLLLQCLQTKEAKEVEIEIN